MRLSESAEIAKVSYRQSQRLCGLPTQKTRKSAFFGTSLSRKPSKNAGLTITQSTTKLFTHNKLLENLRLIKIKIIDKSYVIQTIKNQRVRIIAVIRTFSTE